VSVVRIQIVTPKTQIVSTGNQVTSFRWAQIFERLGHEVDVSHRLEDPRCDLLVALHAKRSAKAVARFAREHATKPKPIVVALTGTDLHRDLARFRSAQQTLARATRLVLLEPEGRQLLPAEQQWKARVIYQSATPVLPCASSPTSSHFDVCVSGHLRYEKDPFRCAMAVRKLPHDSQIRVLHMGAALTPAHRERAIREMQHNGAYRWLGELSHEDAKRRMASCRLLVLTSRVEGAPSVISEAVACEVPILATQITSTIGLLGRDYPGFFPVGDTKRLRHLLLQAENNLEFLATLKAAGAQLKPKFEPAREQSSWRELLGELDKVVDVD